MMRSRRYPGFHAVAAVVGLLALGTPASAPGQTSGLWGQEGEAWSPSGRLGDYSFAGYRTGTEPLPTPTSQLSVAAFGATGNGATDDTAAIKQAIQAAGPGQVVYFPPGTYRFRDVLEIKRGNVVLRGAGESATTILFERSLTDLRGPQSVGLDFPNTPPGGGKRWPFIGGLVWVEGAMPIDGSTKRADVTAAATRGEKELRVSSTSGLQIGQWVLLTQTDPASGSLLRHLHEDLLSGGDERGWRLLEFPTRITAIAGDRITLERPLPIDVRDIWQPEIHAFNPTVEEVGIEDLTLRFPDVAAANHLQEEGFNGIYFYRVANSWVRNVTIVNADSGVFLNFALFNTIKNVTITASSFRASRSGVKGHHGIGLGWLAGDNLITEFDIAHRYTHDITVETVCRGNVISNGTGENINLDHHRKAPHQNLFTNLDLGSGNRPFSSSGPANGGPSSAAFNTYWNVSADRNMSLPPNDFGPRLNFVGFQTSATSASSSLDWRFEAIPPLTLAPPNLHEAQLQRRMNGTGNDPPPDPVPPAAPVLLPD